MNEIIETTAQEVQPPAGIVRVEQSAPINLFGERSPRAIRARAVETANELAEVIKKQDLASDIKGRMHVRVEGWTMLGSLLGVFPVIEWTRPLMHEGKYMGWEARCEVRTMAGAVVGAAEAMCSIREPRWGNADSYAVRSMAQCVPLDSEILTRRGFKRPSELTLGEDVLAYVVEEDRTRWTPLLGVSVFLEPQRLERLTSRSFNLRCTPDHSWAVQRLRGREREPYQELIPANLLKARDNILTAAPEPVGGDSPITPDEAAIIGWLITDGSIVRRGEGIHVRSHIDQSKEPYVSEIRELVGAISRESVTVPDPANTTPSGYSWGTKPVTRFSLTAGATRALLEKAGISGREDAPALVCRLSPASRRAMLDAMLKADGSRLRGGDLWRWGKKNPESVETFLILCALEGIPLGRQHARDDLTFYTMRRHRSILVKALNREDGGREAVWCPTTVHGTWVMRQNGQVTITGNTRAISKAMRGPVGWVMSLAGYEPCPAEEVEEAEGQAQASNPPQAQQQSPHQRLAGLARQVHGAERTGPLLWERLMQEGIIEQAPARLTQLPLEATERALELYEKLFQEKTLRGGTR